MQCAKPVGYKLLSELLATIRDCNDDPANGGASVYPAALEICDGLDNNCNGQVDEVVKSTFYRDADGDGYGDLSLSTQACTPPAGYVVDNRDCNDDPANGGPTVYPGALEICDGLDNDCNGQVDDGVKPIFYLDADGDGYGNPLLSIPACTAPAGYVANSGDCDDTNAKLAPATVWYKDADNDGYSDSIKTIQCIRPAGYKLSSELKAISGDCDDMKASLNPQLFGIKMRITMVTVIAQTLRSV
jgi:hypothetical protein